MYQKVKNLLYLNNFVISLIYTEFKVVFKTKMSNTKPRNWYLSISNVKEMREGENMLSDIVTKPKCINEIYQ